MENAPTSPFHDGVQRDLLERFARTIDGFAARRPMNPGDHHELFTRLVVQLDGDPARTAGDSPQDALRYIAGELLQASKEATLAHVQDLLGRVAAVLGVYGPRHLRTFTEAARLAGIGTAALGEPVSPPPQRLDAGLGQPLTEHEILRAWRLLQLETGSDDLPILQDGLIVLQEIVPPRDIPPQETPLELVLRPSRLEEPRERMGRHGSVEFGWQLLQVCACGHRMWSRMCLDAGEIGTMLPPYRKFFPATPHDCPDDPYPACVAAENEGSELKRLAQEVERRIRSFHGPGSYVRPEPLPDIGPKPQGLTDLEWLAERARREARRVPADTTLTDAGAVLPGQHDDSTPPTED